MSSRDEGIIDVERRKDSAEYTLGDPTVFPPEFLSWLKRFIEQSGIQLPASAIFGSFTAGISSVRNMAPGIILPYASPTPPPGALACDGSPHPRSEFAKLFDIIGTTYGAPDGSSFNVPDYRDRTLFGIGAALAAVTANDGQPHGSRGPAHKHSINDPGHGHGISDPGHSHGGGAVGGVQAPPNGNLIVQDGSHNAAEVIAIQSSGTGIGVNAAATGITAGPPGSTLLDAPAYHGVLYIITTG